MADWGIKQHWMLSDKQNARAITTSHTLYTAIYSKQRFNEATWCAQHCCDIVSSALMITLFRHQWPRHPGEGGDCRDRHRHRPPSLHRETRGRLRDLWGPVTRWLWLPRSEEVIKWGLKLTPSDFVKYRNVQWGWVTSAELTSSPWEGGQQLQQQTNILNSPFPFPRSAMEFFFASEDEMHVITVSSIYLILILLNHCFKIHIVPNRIFIQHYSIGDSISFI